MAYQSKLFQLKPVQLEEDLLQDEEVNEFEDEIKEYNIVVNSIITQNPNFTVCKVSSSNGELIYSNIYGAKKPEYDFPLVVEDPDFMDFIKEKMNLTVSGIWVENDFGRQLKAEEVFLQLPESDVEINRFITHKGLKSLNKTQAQIIVINAKDKNIALKEFLLNPKLIAGAFNSKTMDLEELPSPHEVALDWYRYCQGYFFAQLCLQKKMKKVIAKRIFDFYFSKIRKEVPKIEEIVTTPTKDFYNKAIENSKLYEEVYKHFCENPYRLIKAKGVGFNSIDNFALNLGFDMLDQRRINALMTEIFKQEINKNKDTVIELPKFYKIMSQIKGLEIEKLEEILKTKIQEKEFVIRRMDLGFGEKIYITSDQLFIEEFLTGKQISVLLESEFNFKQEAIDEINSIGFHNDESQTKAIENSYKNYLSIITGGPGSGKTTTLKKLLYIFNKYHPDKEIVLLAPTGVAGKRMTQAINSNKEERSGKVGVGSTIHRMLAENMFVSNFENKVFIIDESSMIDSTLATALLSKIGKNCHVIFVGDIDQIPPVGIGQVMKDLIESNKIPTAKLENIHRTTKDSKLPDIAKIIKEGKLPRDFGTIDEDYCFIPCKNENEIFSTMEDVTIKLLTEKGYKKSDIQLITPQNKKGLCSVESINDKFRWLLNEDISIKEYDFNLKHFVNQKGFNDGDRVINTKNNYELDIFNGEMGIANSVSNGNKSFFLQREGSENDLFIEGKSFFSFNLAYAITIHKSQGSEFPVLIIPLSSSHLFTWNRYLLYTAFTRAKQKVIIIGETDTYIKALKKIEVGNKLTTLKYELDKWKDHEIVYKYIMEGEFFDMLEILDQ